MFSNLTHLDISDNQIQLNQLANLANLEDLDLQYNSLESLAVQKGTF